MSWQSDFVSGTNVNSNSTKVTNTKNLSLNLTPYNQTKQHFSNGSYAQQQAFQQQQYQTYQNSISSYNKPAPAGGSYLNNNNGNAPQSNGYSSSTNGTSNYVNNRINTPPSISTNSSSNNRKPTTNTGASQLQQIYPIVFSSPNQQSNQYYQSPTNSITQSPVNNHQQQQQQHSYYTNSPQKYDMGGSAQSNLQKNQPPQQQQSQQQQQQQPQQPSPSQSNVQQQYPYTSNSYSGGAAYKNSSSSSSSMISNNYSNGQYQVNGGAQSNYSAAGGAIHQYLNHIPPGVQNNQARSPVLVNSIIDLIRKLNIKLIAFDFDLTLVNTHTGGQWIDSPEKLAEFVRPCFRELLPVLLKCSDLFVCIVTYSPQEELIREVLKISLKEEYGINDLLNKMIIIGNTREFLEEHGVENCYSMGKQIHLDQCRKRFESSMYYSNGSNYGSQPKLNARINNASILLIDDDVQNLKMAHSNGHLAFQVNTNMQLVDLYDFLNNQLRN